jgi:anaerobic selenocysteine-containing dehydrogenase
MARGSIAHLGHGPHPVQFVDVMPRTSDQRIHLVPESLEQMAGELYRYRPQPGADSYPLTLISPATSKRTSSTFGQLHREIARLEMNPTDAAERGLSAETEQIRVHNQLGEVHCGLRLSTRVRSGTVVLYKGLWSHNTLNGATANALAPDHLADLGGGACFNDCRVEVEAL